MVFLASKRLHPEDPLWTRNPCELGEWCQCFQILFLCWVVNCNPCSYGHLLVITGNIHAVSAGLTGISGHNCDEYTLVDQLDSIRGCPQIVIICYCPVAPIQQPRGYESGRWPSLRCVHLASDLSADDPYITHISSIFGRDIQQLGV